MKDNTFGGNKNQVRPANHQNNIQAVENELTDHQKELLKIPLNAVRISLLSILPLIFGLILKFVIGDNLTGLVRLNIALLMLCMLQGVRIVIVLTCLHKATETNQAEISQAKRRADMQEWERMTSFKAKKYLVSIYDKETRFTIYCNVYWWCRCTRVYFLHHYQSLNSSTAHVQFL